MARAALPGPVLTRCRRLDTPRQIWKLCSQTAPSATLQTPGRGRSPSWWWLLGLRHISTLKSSTAMERRYGSRMMGGASS